MPKTTPAKRAPMNEAHRRACIDYYVHTHSPQGLAAMLVDLEHEQGLPPPIELDEVE